MRPHELVIEGFGSFSSKQRFTFPSEPGLYFMRGENREEPRLGANGAGKSTIWNALCWLFHGKTPRGLKAGDMGTWDTKKGSSVELSFYPDRVHDDRLRYVYRTWKPNSWVLLIDGEPEPLDLTKDETNPVMNELRLEFESFLQSVYMAQRGAMFLDLKPEPKAALFSSVMGLDKWLRYSSDASQAATDQDRLSRRLESERAELRGRLDEGSTDDLEASAEGFERKRKDRLKEIEEQYLQKMRRSNAAKQRYEDAKSAEDQDQVRTRAVDLVDERNAAFDADDLARKLLRKAQDVLLTLKEDLRHAEEHRELIFKDDGCPTCGRRFGTETQDSLETRADRDLRNAQSAFEAQQDIVSESQRELDRVSAVLQIADKLCQDAVSSRDGAYEDTRNARRAHELEERGLDTLEDESERVEKEPNPFATMLGERRESLARLKEEYGEVTRKLDQSYEKHALYSFWIKGFKEVRLQLISEALQQLEIEVNSELMALGLGDWELRFDVDAETKKGTLTRGFSVSVLSPHNQERVAWESWSGGESQRLRLAAQCGLGNLIRDRTGCDLPLEVWDEPTEGLSEEGISDLLTALNERAIREQRTIWIVDHRSLGYGGFAGTVTIVKDDKGSRIIQARV